MAKLKTNVSGPTFDEFIIPILAALKELGGSGSIEEINEKASEIKNIPEDILLIPHGSNGALTEVDYRMAWARTYLKKYGLINNSARGVWALTKFDIDLSKIDPTEVVRKVKSLDKRQTSNKNIEDKSDQIIETEETVEWKEKLIKILVDELSPAAFERLAQRLLRESGFSQVEVTGRSGDGGIDGKGIAKVSGFLSFHVMFQCKRYKGAITPSQIRDFRGANVGRTDKGLFITTG